MVMARRHSAPEAIAAHLPVSDRRSSAEELTDGRWVVAGRHALILLDEGGVVDSGMWYEIQRARWNGETRQLVVLWVDPARRPLAVTTVTDDPDNFMLDVSAKVDHARVVQKVATTPSGTVVTAAVRRGESGELFSTLVADGPLDEEGRGLADALEREVREGVGLE